ncbi:MAG: hypothetical protein JNM21_12625 [Taibaiella sp.]|nr:hypothetical protein [Taibaiella sp.]
MKSVFISLLVITFFNSCSFRTNTFEEINHIAALGKPVKIEYFRNIIRKPLQYNQGPEFVSVDQTEIEEMLAEIKQANDPELWKGAIWDIVVITYADTILRLHTDTKKIGSSASGNFFYLDKNNFITKRLAE